MDCMNVKERKPLHLVFGDVTLGVHGEGFDYLFSYTAGGPVSLVTDGKEWLYRAPKPTFWRAVTDNDRGNKFPLRSGMWLGADMFISCTDICVQTDGTEIPFPTAPENNKYNGEETADKVRIIFTYETVTVPVTTVTAAYEVMSGGRIKVEVHYHGRKELPELPVFGMRFILPTKAVSYRYEGLSGETYPDRMAGAVPGIYEVEGLPVTGYLVPQDCQVHMGTKWLEIYRDTTLNNADRKAGKNSDMAPSSIETKETESQKTFGIRFSSTGEDFAFCCIPYTAEELENATHMEELPPARRTVVSILGAVRGVGGIDTWGADVEPAYHIDAGKDIRYSFLIERMGN